MESRDGSPARTDSSPPRRATYGADYTFDPPTEQPPTASRRPPLGPVAPSNFFSSSSSSTSSTRPNPQRTRSSAKSTSPKPHELVIDTDEEPEVVNSSSRQRPRPPTRSRSNPWNTQPRQPPQADQTTTSSQFAMEEDDWNVHIENSSSPTSPSFPSRSKAHPSPKTSPYSDDLPVDPNPPLAPSPPVPSVSSDARSSARCASAHPECDGDGRWSTARLLAREGEGGSKAGIWKWEAFDFEVEETPKDGKYKAMGEWINLSPARGEDKMEQEGGGEGKRKLVDGETEEEPEHGFRTITKSELDSIRPHPNLFFCSQTFSWGLFSKLPVVLSDYTAPGVKLWRFDEMQNFRKDLPPHESVNCALFEVLEPPLPDPLLPFDPLSLRTAPHYDFPPRNHPSLRTLKLSYACSTKPSRLLFSRQDFFPSVLGRELWQNWLKTRGEHPQPGQTSSQAEADSVSFLWRALDDALFKGETRALPIKGKTFSRAMPWDDISCDIFLSVLGYKLRQEGESIAPPNIDHRSESGQANRTRLLRTWLETGVWLQEFTDRTNDVSVKRVRRIKLIDAKPRMMEIAGGDECEPFSLCRS
ncbi:uncharacterized protein JCM6883_003257 [Sporobolomyces salmoneus]|uniref:uncharacterized protein n=1 Tax=Sporobolomyces salmoneus TaxID=183962 RepID=UPI00317D21F5